MSYLYSTFAQLVSVHCKATAATSAQPVNQCKRNLLSYGYEKLQTFSNDQLDLLDPYQRDANGLIWAAIMREHPSATLITTRKPLPTPPATSIIILTHQSPEKPKATDESTTSKSTEMQYGKNPIFDNEENTKHEFAMDMDIAYGFTSPLGGEGQVETFDALDQERQQQRPQVPGAEQPSKSEPQTYLTGPLVFRVRPDGSPVEEDQYRPMPSDDDELAFFQTAGNARADAPPAAPTEAKADSNESKKPSAATSSSTSSSSTGRPTKHRKIATISALKQQYLTNLALQQQLLPPVAQPLQELQPPFEQTRSRPRRQQHPLMLMMNTFGGYYGI